MELYVSSGAFTGRVNGRNPHLLADNWQRFDCDGFEWMLFDEMEARAEELIDLYRKAKVPIAVLHANKRTGDLMGNPDEGAREALLSLFTSNCRIAQAVGAKKIVAHIWGRPYSDQYWNLIVDQAGTLLDISAQYGLDLVAENCACFSSPLSNMEKLAAHYPNIGFTVDTRPAQFHRELEQTVRSPVFTQNMRHVHINDYKGGYMQWNALYPIYQPGEGEIDFSLFFRAVREKHPNCSITLEAPAMRPDFVNVPVFNKSLKYIRDHLSC